jgi:fumarate reductase subunit D
MVGREGNALRDGTGKGQSVMATSTILLIIVILLLLGAVPAWPHSRSWGYGPSGVLGVILLILVILLLMGRL